MAKLNAEERKLEMVRLHRLGHSPDDLASKFKVTEDFIQEVVSSFNPGREQWAARRKNILDKRTSGRSLESIASEYFASVKSIQKNLREERHRLAFVRDRKLRKQERDQAEAVFKEQVFQNFKRLEVEAEAWAACFGETGFEQLERIQSKGLFLRFHEDEAGVWSFK